MADKNNDVNRAAQFLPFDALKGLSEELQERIDRRTRVQKHDFSEEQKEELSKVLCKIEKGTKISVTFYCNGHYFNLHGEVSKVNPIYQYLLIGQKKIFYDDIYDIDIIS